MTKVNEIMSKNTVSILSAISAAVLTLATVAVPANASEAELSTAAWTAKVSRSLDSNLRPVNGVHSAMREKAATLTAHFDGEGRFAGTTMATSSGSALLDREARRAANTVRYPVLPTALRQGRTVTIEISFADDATGLRGRGVPRHRLVTRRNEVPAARPQG